jgi:two-component system, cell cycle response regulator
VNEVSDKPIHVLLIEDNPGDTRLIRESFNDAGGGNFELTCADTLAGGLACLAERAIDVILLDLSLPDSFGLETIGRVQAKAPDMPIVVLTGHRDDTLSVTAVQAGAQDYLIKGEVEGNLLVRSLRYAIERQRMSMVLRSLSLIDELTGLYNRRAFLSLAVQQLKSAERLEQRMMLLFADLDDLKWINDNMGHSGGDLALKETAAILKKTFRGSDIIARLGGDEFVVLVMDTGGESADAMSERLTASLETYNSAGNPYRLSMSIGVAHYDPALPCTIDDLLDCADSLMYEEKKAKRKD